jgi:hypothetical protein
MKKPGKTDQFTLSGWSAAGALAMIAVTKALTALVLSYPLVWLANHEFATGGAIRAVFGTDQVSYWRCVGLFAIWHVAQIRIKLSGPAKIEIQGDR